MSAFFNSPERADEFRRRAAGWLGTPFVPHAAVKGAGVDCVNLGRELYAECGLVIPKELPDYAMDGGKHNEESQLVTWLESSGRFRWIGDRWEIPAIHAGDTLCFKIGRSAHHAGFSLGGTEFIHCLFGREVMLGDLRDKTFARILFAIYRPLT